jgi:hypothetical protein
MDIYTLQRSIIKYNSNYYYDPFYIVIISIIVTINFAYLLKYFNFNEC